MKFLKRIFCKISNLPKSILVFMARGIFEIVKFLSRLPKNLFILTKKIVVIVKNPKIIWLALKNFFYKAKIFFKRLPKRTREYFFWLIMSPQANVWRLERKKIQNIPTISEIKEYQKHLRKKTFGFVFAGAMAVMLVFTLPGLFTKYFAHSKGYRWIQNDWSTGAVATYDSNGQITGNESVGTNGSNWSLWKKFWSKTGGNAIKTDTAGALKLESIGNASVVENTSGTYSAGNYSGGNYSGIKSGADYPTNGVYTIGGAVKLKKPLGGTCGTTGDGIGNNECANNSCWNNKCCGTDACCGLTQLVDVRGAESITYPIVAIGNQCWMAENLRATLTPPSPAPSPLTDITASTKCAVDGCGSPWGRLYNYSQAMNGHAAASGLKQKIQGICPAGWHVPSDWGTTSSPDPGEDLAVLVSYLGGESAAGGAMKRTEATYWTNNSGATNSSGFSAVGNGNYYNQFNAHKTEFDMWSSFDNGYRYIMSGGAVISRNYDGARSNAFYLSVRCIKD